MTSLEEARAEAERLGISFDGRSTLKSLQKKIRAAQKAEIRDLDGPATEELASPEIDAAQPSVTAGALDGVSLAIMGHPSRMELVMDLKRVLPNAEIAMDERNDRWDTGRRAMLAYDPECAWHIVVQDDAILCRDFIAGAERALTAAGDHPVAFYTGRVRPNEHLVNRMVSYAQLLDRSWLAMKGPWWGVSVGIPTDRIEAMVEWCDQRTEIANYDTRMARYFEHVGIDCYYTMPSLVDHRPHDQIPSLVPGRNGRGRVAHWFIGGASPLEVDWTTEPITPSTTPPSITRRWRNRRTGSVRQARFGTSLDLAYQSSPGWDPVE